MTKSAPIFQFIFGEQWQNLPPVMHKHYANRAGTSDAVTVEGFMKIEVSTFAKLLTPLFRLSGALVPYSGENIPVTVNFRSEKNSSAYCFNRIFNFPNKPPYHFRSKMLPIGGNVCGNQVVEFMPIGIGWNASYRWDGKKVLIEHCGYKMKIFGKLLPFPLEWFLGKGRAWEEAISDDKFKMYMDIRHPLFGRIYAYSGEFTVTKVELDE